MGTVSIAYVTDPFCPWSWGVEPSWRRLHAEFADRVSITYVISGLGGAQPDPREWRVRPRAVLGGELWAPA